MLRLAILHYLSMHTLFYQWQYFPLFVIKQEFSDEYAEHVNLIVIQPNPDVSNTQEFIYNWHSLFVVIVFGAVLQLLAKQLLFHEHLLLNLSIVHYSI